MKRRIISLSIILLTSCLMIFCESLNRQRPLTLKNYKNNVRNLRMDGYWYKKNVLTSEAMVLYENGVLLDLSSPPTNTDKFQHWEEYLIPYIISGASSAYDYYSDWGVFETTKDSIRFERYYPPSGGPWVPYIRSGIILNDSTFLITEARRSYRKEVEKENILYGFRRFSPKPDSTNRFIP